MSTPQRGGLAQAISAQSVAEVRPSPEVVVATRAGHVLIKHTVLKADHFPSCHNTKLSPILDGAPNFRKVDGLPVYGVAIPTVTGLRNVLRELTKDDPNRKVYWQNLREEPLVYINGAPFVVREADQPFSNLEYTGIDKRRVEAMEDRLKSDILAEAKRMGNQILVVHENADLTLFDHWEPVTAADVQTPGEVFDELAADGFSVDYLRIPVTDEKAPKDQDFQMLINRVWGVDSDAAIIFNCQMGRGRTTTGMIIASLLHLRKIEAFPIKRNAKPRDDVPTWFQGIAHSNFSKIEIESGEITAEKLKHGMYGAVRSLLRALDKGPEAKHVLDAVIDACSAMQNLREGINSYRARFLKEIRERQRNTLLGVCLEYLERYYMLIAFSGYLESPQFDPGAALHTSFPDWMDTRTELRSILSRLLRRNSMAALELHVRIDEDDQNANPHSHSGVNRAAMDVVACRSGAVLGPFTILKEDNFPGMLSPRVTQVIEGAPNFRRMGAMPIFGVGMPTVDGIIGVLKLVSGSTSGKRVQALWINMREEPVVYINGRPFVLREEVRPLKNMMEYEGIDFHRLEAMEERLKKDVLAEALKHGGRILVANESFDSSSLGTLNDTWEEIDHPDAVQTTVEVYLSLKTQGFAVQYARVPVTDGEVPSLVDFDELTRQVLEFGREQPVIFNCQMGNGRTTMGMVVAGMLHIHTEGAIESMRSAAGYDNLHQDNLGDYIMEGVSPRSEGEDLDWGDFRDEEDEKMKKVWDLEPEEVEEQKSLAAGGYVGVRRVVRLLEEGEGSKNVVDNMVDAASDMINLRVAIMKYRKPRSLYKYIRPELQQRNGAFKKGTAYLKRYCMLISYAFYLEHVGPEATPFSGWVDQRPDLTAALAAIQSNPAAALAPLPVATVPQLYTAGDENVDLTEQTRVLSKRRGRTLGRRTILKSHIPPDDEAEPDVRQADGGLPIYSVGSVNADDMQRLLHALGAGESSRPGAPMTHVLITDVREELCVYINGVPYIRRELEMPAAALHHAGVQSASLEELEQLLNEDVVDEVAKWGGRVLLHQECRPNEPDVPAAINIGRRASDYRSSDTGPPSNFGTPTHKLLAGLGLESSKWEASLAEATKEGGKAQTDVTAPTELRAEVSPFWETVDVASPYALASPRSLMEVFMAPKEAGGAAFRISYARIPLSRERTPEAWDLAELHRTIQQAESLRNSGCHVVHLILSRTSTGSSARFVAAALGSFYIVPPPPSPGAGGVASPLSAAKGQGLPLGGVGSPGKSKGLSAEDGEYRGIMSLCRLLPRGIENKLTVDSALVSLSQIGNLLDDIHKCRKAMGRPQASGPSAIPVGMGEAETGGASVAAKAAGASTAAPGAPGAPAAAAATAAGAGAAAAVAAPEAPAPPKPAVNYARSELQYAARQLGIHYLKRYFLLVCFRTYLSLGINPEETPFNNWVQRQRELDHLLGHLNLDV
ncbi:hypothetical protein FOA52_009910 [Chlamydomonas sp. UWO 241]|nr:hypothetical protein FOA52_009910 [Chlamydomonas sp. UWO 241]